MEWSDLHVKRNFVQTFQTANGCDSIVTLHLTISRPIENEIAVIACDSYEWNGRTYTASGDYVQTFHSANNCDSVVILHLTINRYTTNEITETACDSYEWNAQTYTTNGDYIQTFHTANGCDSIVTLHLTVGHSVAYEFYDTTDAESYVWNDSIYTMSGEYVQAFVMENDCDSVVTLHLEFVAVGIDEFIGINTNVYPNPAKDNLYVVSDKHIIYIELFDVAGKIISQIDVNDSSAICNVSSLTAGMYFIRVHYAENGWSENYKFIKE